MLVASVYKVLLHAGMFSAPSHLQALEKQPEKVRNNRHSGSNSDTDPPCCASSGPVLPLLILSLLICEMEVLLPTWVGTKMKKYDLTVALRGCQNPPVAVSDPLLPLP